MATEAVGGAASPQPRGGGPVIGSQGFYDMNCGTNVVY